MKKLLIFCIALSLFLISCGTEKKAEVQTEEPAIVQEDTAAVDTSAVEVEGEAEME